MVTLSTIRLRFDRGLPFMKPAVTRPRQGGLRDRAKRCCRRCWATALRRGGDFAEVFAEDRRASSAALDDGKVEELSSGRDRGAGVRVVVGETTGYAHTADLTEAGLLAAAEAAAAAARGGSGGGRRWSTSPGARSAGRTRSMTATRDRCEGRQGRAAQAGRRGRSGRRLLDRAGVGLVRRQPTPHPRREHRRPPRRATTRSRPSSRVSARGERRHRHADGLRVDGPHDRLRVVRPLRRRGSRPRGRRARRCTKLHARPAPSGRMPVVIKQGRRRRAVPRGVRARPRGRPRREGCVGVQGPEGRAGGVAARDARRRRDDGRASGAAFGIDDEGHASAAQRADRGRRAHRLHVGLPPGPQGGSAVVRATGAGRATTTCRWCA